jgi:hypothetical protein
LELNNVFPATASPPLEAAATAGVALAAAGAGAAAGCCANKLKEDVSKNAILRNKFLEIELWLPTFFIF